MGLGVPTRYKQSGPKSKNEKAVAQSQNLRETLKSFQQYKVKHGRGLEQNSVHLTQLSSDQDNMQFHIPSINSPQHALSHSIQEFDQMKQGM